MSWGPGEQARDYEKVSALGMDPVEIIGNAYRSYDRSVTQHDNRLREARAGFPGLAGQPPDAGVVTVFARQQSQNPEINSDFILRLYLAGPKNLNIPDIEYFQFV